MVQANEVDKQGGSCGVWPIIVGVVTCGRAERRSVMAGRLRGALIVLEGCDRAGKTTQCRKLVAALSEAGFPAKGLHFPGSCRIILHCSSSQSPLTADRTTPLGKQIDSYLKQEQQLDDHAIHLLFSANRWEHA